MKLFKQIAPGIPLPPRPIITRWGTWLKANEYYKNHMSAVVEVLLHVEHLYRSLKIVVDIRSY